MNQYLPEGILIKKRENFEYTSTIEGLYRAVEKQTILEAPVLLCDHNFNLHIELPCMKGIIPREEVGIKKNGEEIKDIAILTRVGKVVCFKVIGFETGDDGKKRAILSRRAAQEECFRYYVEGLLPGDIIPSRVTHIENFGAFVDIGCGIISLLSIDSISVSRISHPSVRISVGDHIYTVVKAIDESGRVYVSMKELLGNWTENAKRFSEGQTVRGIVRSIENYGIFVELAPNLAGLAEFREGVKEGQSAAVYIKSIIPEKMKVKLIIIDTDNVPVTRTPIEYFIDIKKTDHLESWTYSPKISKRTIETVF